MTGPLQVVLGTISVLFLIVASVMFYRAVRAMVRIIRTGQPDGTRFGPVKTRIKTLPVESLGHTRMLKWSTIGAAHWFVFIGFYGLFLTLVEAFGEVWNPAFHLPLIGEFFLWNLFADIIGAGTILGILYLIYRRQKDHPRRQGRGSRFAGSNEGRGYFVEAVVLSVGICILLHPRAEGLQRPDRHPGLVAPDLQRAGDRAARQPRPAHASSRSSRSSSA